MRKAFDNIAPDVLNEMTTNYCEAILQAETLEEVAEIKAGIPEAFKECGCTEEQVTALMQTVDNCVKELESGVLVIDEGGRLAYNESATNQTTATDAVTQSDAVSPLAVGGFSAVAACMVGVLAFKKNVLKRHSKNNVK